MSLRSRILSIVIPALVAGITIPVPALAQTSVPGETVPSGTPTVDIKPLGTSPSDPGGGVWFYASATPGHTVEFTAQLANSASIPQTVHAYLADLVYNGDSPNIGTSPYKEVGNWGAFDNGGTVVVPPRERVSVKFRVTPPSDLGPGDYLGLVVLEHGRESGGGQFAIVKKVATKIILTVPGDAPREFSIRRVTIEKDSVLYPREATVRVSLHNDGRIRLQPTVGVNGVQATGSALLFAKSTETYIATLKLPWWGGPVRYRIDAATRSGDFPGPSRQQYASAFIIPWHLLFVALGLFLTSLAVRFWWRRRGSKYTSLQSDLLRIERLLAGQQGGAATQSPDVDPELAILAAMKQARRTGDAATEQRLQEKLDQARANAASRDDDPAPIEIRRAMRRPAPRRTFAPVDAPEAGDALGAILAELRDAPAERVDGLVAAARAYGFAALRAHAGAIDALPSDVRLKVLFRGAQARGPRSAAAKSKRP